MSQQDIDDAVKEAGVGESKPAESQPTEQPAAEQPTQEAAAQPEQQAIQPAKEEGTFKWWVVAIPLIVLILLWIVFIFFL